MATVLHKFFDCLRVARSHNGCPISQLALDLALVDDDFP